jgi:hypothetical protein
LSPGQCRAFTVFYEYFTGASIPRTAQGFGCTCKKKKEKKKRRKGRKKAKFFAIDTNEQD